MSKTVRKAKHKAESRRYLEVRQGKQRKQYARDEMPSQYGSPELQQMIVARAMQAGYTLVELMIWLIWFGVGLVAVHFIIKWW